MNTTSDALWRSYIDQLSSFAGIPPSLFQVVPNLTSAMWEVLDITGINPPANVGQPLSQRIYNWADPMPRQGAASYEAGGGLYDMYRTLLLNLKTSAAVQGAVAASVRYTMADPAQGSTPAGPPFPGYAIDPGLANWYQAALQTLTSGADPVLDFTVRAGAQPANSQPARLGAAPAAMAASASSTTGLDGGATAIDRPFLPALDVPRIGLKGPGGGPPPPPGMDGLTLRYTAQSIGAFTVQPDRWFESTTLSVYADQLVPGSPLIGKKLFGPGGLIAFRLSTIMVAFRRSVTITGTTAQISAIKQAHGSGAGEIGGFAFGTQTTPSASTSTSLTLKDNTNTPYVIAIGATPLGP